MHDATQTSEVGKKEKDHRSVETKVENKHKSKENVRDNSYKANCTFPNKCLNVLLPTWYLQRLRERINNQTDCVKIKSVDS